LVRILKGAHDFVSGEEMAEKLGVSRAAVWKSIDRLRKMGFDVSASTNRGYRLVSIPDTPSAEVMSSLINTTVFGRSIEYHPAIASTNDRAMELGARGVSCGTVVTADRQTAGKARNGGVWPSPPGKNLYLSVVVRPGIPLARSAEVAELAVKSLGMGAGRFFPGICFSSRNHGLFFQGKKLGGVLCEVRGEIGLVYYMAVGIGLNVSHSRADSNTTSLFLVTGKMLSRAELTIAVLEEFEKHYLKWQGNE
jgi:BirA family biotin operon repressor/biotin-[acetyl-CoA-carboxylase] ligase